MGLGGAKKKPPVQGVFGKRGKEEEEGKFYVLAHNPGRMIILHHLTVNQRAVFNKLFIITYIVTNPVLFSMI